MSAKSLLGALELLQDPTGGAVAGFSTDGVPELPGIPCWWRPSCLLSSLTMWIDSTSPRFSHFRNRVIEQTSPAVPASPRGARGCSIRLSCRIAPRVLVFLPRRLS